MARLARIVNAASSDILNSILDMSAAPAAASILSLQHMTPEELRAYMIDAAFIPANASPSFWKWFDEVFEQKKAALLAAQAAAKNAQQKRPSDESQSSDSKRRRSQ